MFCRTLSDTISVSTNALWEWRTWRAPSGPWMKSSSIDADPRGVALQGKIEERKKGPSEVLYISHVTHNLLYKLPTSLSLTNQSVSVSLNLTVLSSLQLWQLFSVSSSRPSCPLNLQLYKYFYHLPPSASSDFFLSDIFTTGPACASDYSHLTSVCVHITITIILSLHY